MSEETSEEQQTEAAAAPTNAISLPAGVTPEQVQAWKQKYGEVHLITISPSPEDPEEHRCLIRKIDRLTMRRIAPLAESDPIKAAEIMVENCWLAGDERIKTNDDLFYAASKMFGSLIKQRDAEIAKL